MLWDRGFWMPEGTKDVDAALRKGELKFTLAGEKLQGSFVLVRMKHDRDRGKRNNWLLIKHRDEFARERRCRRRGQVGRFRPLHGADRGRQGPGPQAVHGSRRQGVRSQRHLALEPRPKSPRPSGGRGNAAILSVRA